MAKKILIVDDSPTILRQLEHCLTTAGYETLQARNGEEGLALAESVDVDMAIIDVDMPVMNGLELLQRLRELPGHEETPVFLTTTESCVESSEKGRASGATAWVVKPLNQAHLLEGVKRAMAPTKD